jgi:hypothetical protein
MPDNVVALPQRGKTYLNGPNRTADATATTSLAIEGIKKVFKDLDYTGTAGNFAKAPRSGGEVECVLARNASAISLLPGRVCVWKSAKQGKQVDGYVSLDSGQVAGVVDEWLPSTGVVTNDYFWLVRKGPCLVRKSLDANTLAKDDYVIAITAATSQATTAGRITSIISTSNQTYCMSAALNRLGIAISTSATTDANVLVYLDIAP